MSDNPLVSIVVITYNSEKTVLETLDSIAAQTYKNIELIVSDDGSKDKTVEIVNDWKKQHNNVNACLVTNLTNTGTVRNLNRGIRASKGVWIKSIAGDDCLKPNAIEKFIDYTNNHTDCHFCVSRLKLFCTDGDVPKETRNFYDHYNKYSKEDLQAQKKRILNELVFPGPGWFYSKSLWLKLGQFDEDYVLLEEWPFCYSAISQGCHINFIDEELVNYRITNTSVCRSRKDNLINPLLFKDLRRFFYKQRMMAKLKNGEFIQVLKEILHYERTMLRYY